MSIHLHFDLVGGMAGDMTVAALLDAGADLGELQARLHASGLPVSDVSVVRDKRGGLAGARFVVQPEESPPARTWGQIRKMLEDSRLAARPREMAVSIFEALAQAEASVHGTTEENVHFHEVGAMDSIVDIVATALLLDLLDVKSVSCGGVPVCEGTVRTSHGSLPLPAPATARLLQGFTLVPIPGQIETVTPTGAAILAVLCPGGGGQRPPARLLGTGTGLGSASLPDRPNALRALLGEPVDAAATPARGDAVVIEADIDDMDPRLYGAVSASLFAAGALDVHLAALQMKKGRPGTRLGVVCRPELEGVLTGIVLRETTTLGVRSHDVRRTELQRSVEPVETAFGTVGVKIGLLGGECVQVAPEYDDCANRAAERGVPVKDVLAAAAAAAADRWSTAC